MPSTFLRFTCILLASLLGGWALTGCAQTPNALPSAPSFVYGQTAYIPFEEHLQIINISQPTQPQLVGRYTATGLINHVQAGDGWVVVGHVGEYDPLTGTYPTAAVYILKEGRNQNLTRAATISLTEPPQLVAWHGRYLFISTLDNTAVYDLQNPAAPTFIAQWPVLTDNVQVDEQTVYTSFTACYFRTGICTAELREMTLPITNSTTWHTTYNYGEGSNIQRMGWWQDRLIVVGEGVTAVPRTQLDQLPDFVAAQNTDSLRYGYHTLMAMNDSHLFVTFGYKLIIYSMANPAQPQFLYEITAASQDTYFTQMALQGDYLYLASQYGLHVYHIASPEVYGAGLLTWTAENPPALPFAPQPSPTP